MYARVAVVADHRPNALVVPTNAVVDVGGQRGVFLAQEDNTATFRPVELGIEEQAHVEVRSGIKEGDRIVTTGAAGLRDGDRFVLSDASPRGNRGGARQGRAGAGGRGAAGAQ